MSFSTNILLLTAAAVVIVWILLSAVGSSGRGSSGERGCPVCGGSNPPFASYCRRCGKRL